jgi:hypothetical protein
MFLLQKVLRILQAEISILMKPKFKSNANPFHKWKVLISRKF